MLNREISRFTGKKLFSSFIGVFFITALISTVTTFAGEKTKTYEYKNFENIGVSSGMQLEVRQSDDYSIKVTGDEEDFDDLIVEKTGEGIRFRFEDHFFGHHGDMKIEITMPKLTGLGLSGGAEANINMNIGDERFSAGLSGSSELKGNLKCGDVHLATSGSSEITLNGNCEDMKLAGSGGSEYHMKNFSARNVKVALSGGTEVTITMNGELTFVGSGGSQLTYYGKAELGKIMASGGAGVTRGD